MALIMAVPSSGVRLPHYAPVPTVAGNLQFQLLFVQLENEKGRCGELGFGPTTHTGNVGNVAPCKETWSTPPR